jgi:CHAT domain-containing protein
LSAQVAQILARSNNDDSTFQHRILSLVYVLDGQLERALRELSQLLLNSPNDASVHNDIGVVEMGLAASDPRAWLKALGEFESAASLRPNFPEATFNLILSSRHLGLHRLASIATDEYQKIEPSASWSLLIRSSKKSEDEAPSLQERLETAHQEEISELVRRYPSRVRQLILNFAFRPVLPIPPNYQRAADELSDKYEDDTAKAALVGLSTNGRQAIVHMRYLVDQGRKSYLQGHLEESRRLYDTAGQIAANTNSTFDHVWFEINAADTMQRSLDYSHAVGFYQDAIAVSRRHRLKWLLARALSSFGTAPALSGSVINAIAHLNEAVELYRQMGETAESSRPLYFLGAYHSIAGSYDESLEFALECVNITDPADHFRLSEVDLLVSRDLNWTGQTTLAIHFNEEAAEHAVKLDNPSLIARTKIELASAYLANNRQRDAATQLDEARALLPRMSTADRASTEVPLNVIHARVAILSGDFTGAESELRRNIKFRSENKDADVIRDYRSRIVLADALGGQGRNEEAAVEVRKAIEFVEDVQDSLPTDTLQISFDHDRRSIYDSAIRFAYKQAGCRESWNLTQQYKAKLFLNSMEGYGPSPGGGLGSERLSLERVQGRLPNMTQIVDYLTLGDQLLVWVISRNDFQCRSVPVTTTQLNEKIALFVSQVFDRQSADKISQDLYDVLVQPIADLLEPAQTIVIVPDANLYRLPFSALRSRRTGRYWIETAAIAETPSVTYLLSGSPLKPSNAAHIAFGSRRYDALTNAELNAIQQADPAIRFEAGPEVTKDRFLQSLHDSSIVYYAGHSSFDMQNVLQSSILLDGDKPGPNTVSALDIMKQRIRKNALILLSSCETSLGTSTDGAGIGGLTSAFLLGGAGAVVGSLWPVESVSTMQLMSRTFDAFIHQHQSLAESLRAAQIALIHNPTTKLPYYWSGFVVTGNGSAIKP